MAVGNQKLRTLYLMDILLERTDEEHILNASELSQILDQEYGISSDRRTIYSEIETLQTYGLEIEQKKGRTPGYYVIEREYELPELKLLVDAVQASKFITEQKSQALIGKLKRLCSKSQAKTLQRDVFIADRPKTENETIYYNVDYIHTAIAENKQIRFHYVEWTVKKTLQQRKNGAYYVVSPWALTWDDENYYLVAYSEETGEIRHYRVDKMQHTDILDAERKGEEQFRDFNLAEYAKKTFGMFRGKDEEVIFRCKKEMAGVMIDRFGQDIWLIPDGEEYFRTRVKISVSRQFFGWVTGIGTGIHIEGPENVKAEYKAYMQEILNNY